MVIFCPVSSLLIQKFCSKVLHFERFIRNSDRKLSCWIIGFKTTLEMTHQVHIMFFCAPNKLHTGKKTELISFNILPAIFRWSSLESSLFWPSLCPSFLPLRSRARGLRRLPTDGRARHPKIWGTVWTVWLLLLGEWSLPHQADHATRPTVQTRLLPGRSKQHKHRLLPIFVLDL